jgi:hypothetical protein
MYRKQLRILDGRGALFAIADDVKIMGPPEVIAEMAEGFPALAWEEAGLTTQTVKNRIFVQESAQRNWNSFLQRTPRNMQSALPVHDIPDGSELVDSFDLDSERFWAEENGVNILGTPMGSPAFVSSYLQGKGLKHHLLLRFIKDVASAGYPREAELMLKGAAVPRLSHILRSIQKDQHSRGWMRDMDEAHLSAWLHCLSASDDLEHALGAAGRSQLSDLLDLPPSYGGAGLQSLEDSADEEFVGSFAAIAASLIAFCRKTEVQVYISIAEALEELDSPDCEGLCPTLRGVHAAMERTEHLREPLTAEEAAGATDLVKGTRIVEVPGRFDQDKPDPAPEPITLPEPRLVSDFVTATCRHECSILKQVRHAKKAHRVLSALNPVKQALLRATAGQCGMDTARCSMVTVREVASMDRPGKGNEEADAREASLFCAATLHRFGLPVDYARLKDETLPETCACCKAPLWDAAIQGSRMDRIFAWQCHMGRCGGDGRRLQAHEVVKRTMRDLVLSNTTPGGAAFPSSSIVIEPLHLRSDKSRPGDILALGRDVHRMDTAMDLVIASALTKSCLTSSSRSSDFVLKGAERAKFGKDRRSVNPISASSTMRFVPLALNHLGLRGPHFQSLLKEFASILVTKPEGCSLLRGPFALSHSAALKYILGTWGARITWTAQREHAGQILRGLQAFHDGAAFSRGWVGHGGTGDEG